MDTLLRAAAIVLCQIVGAIERLTTLAEDSGADPRVCAALARLEAELSDIHLRWAADHGVRGDEEGGDHD